MNSSICPKCKTKLERTLAKEGAFLKFIGTCDTCDYSADVTEDAFRDDKQKTFSEGKLKQFLATCPKPSLNDKTKRTYSELKEIMQTSNEELADEILKKYIDLGKIAPFAIPGKIVDIFIINPNQ